jgi:hypothetical protein
MQCHQLSDLFETLTDEANAHWTYAECMDKLNRKVDRLKTSFFNAAKGALHRLVLKHEYFTWVQVEDSTESFGFPHLAWKRIIKSKLGGTGPIDHAQSLQDSLPAHVVLRSLNDEAEKRRVGRVIDILQHPGNMSRRGIAGPQKRREKSQADAAHREYFRRCQRAMTRYTESFQYCL